MPNKTKILVDGNCIICDWEISHYKRIHPELFEIVDISDPSFKAPSWGLLPEDVILNMHVQTPEGQFLIGIDAFAHIWSQIPRYRWAYTLIRIPGIYGLSKIAYRLFTWIRPYLPKKR